MSDHSINDIDYEHMGKWLVEFQVNTSGEEFLVPILLQADGGEMAERGANYMGKHWWPGSEEGVPGWFWSERGDVSLIGLNELYNQDFEVLCELDFLHIWVITGTPADAVVTDHGGYTRADHRSNR